MTEFSKKSKKPILDILGPFCTNLGKNEFCWKNAKLTDVRQTDNGDFRRPFIGWGSKKGELPSL